MSVDLEYLQRIVDDVSGNTWDVGPTGRRVIAEAIAELQRFDLRAHLQRQREWSERTFGPGPRAQGIVDHIKKELVEIEAAPRDLEEWIDVAILALDGAWRAGYSPDEIIAQLVAKQAENEARQWPDWRTAEPGKAIEHVRGCPTCSSPRPALHPAVQQEGEVHVCSDPFHGGAL